MKNKSIIIALVSFFLGMISTGFMFYMIMQASIIDMKRRNRRKEVLSRARSIK